LEAHPQEMDPHTLERGTDSPTHHVNGPRGLAAKDRAIPSARNGGPAMPAVARAGAQAEAALRRAAVARDTLYRRLLAVADLSSAALALVVDALLLGDDRLNAIAFVAIPVVVAVSKVVGLYDRDAMLVKRSTLDEAPALFGVATLYTFVIWLAEGFFIEGEGAFGRDQLLALWVLLFGFMLLARSGARTVARTLAPEERCLVLGGSSDADVVRRKLGQAQGVKARVVGRVPLGQALEGGGEVPLLGESDALETVLREWEIDRVIIAPGGEHPDRLFEAIMRCRACGVRTSVLPRLLEVVGSSVELDELSGATLLAIRRYGLTRSARMLKRTVDVVGATAGFILLAPLFAAIAVAIKLNSPGPVLFKQRRMGCNDRVFEMLKFRTMVRDADEQKAELAARNEAEGLFKISDDPRVTAVGRFLRRTSLDELPQLVNVLRGEMSLVGPRPLVVDEDRHVQGWERRRLLVRPGMTGLWQIFGSARIPLREMVKIDYVYGANWSLWLDLKILLRTVPYVFGRRGL
jgi:exopolysaccharide biosynthesis polyprenyl glycosylphosphotransferase